MKLKKNKLNLGSGADKKEGFVNMDWNPLTKPDIQHNLNKFPYPFEDNTFDYIEARHVLEHLEKPFNVMKELHRILKPGGELLVKVPHFSRGFTHAEHEHGFDVTFPLYFNPHFTSSGFVGTEFEIKRIKIKWLAHLHLLKYLGYGPLLIFVLSLTDKIISFFANMSKPFASRIWCFWVGGFEEIEFLFFKK